MRLLGLLVVLAVVVLANWYIMRSLNPAQGPAGTQVQPTDRVREDVNRAVDEYEKRLKERDRQIEPADGGNPQ